jgi:hypothetical protein
VFTSKARLQICVCGPLFLSLAGSSDLPKSLNKNRGKKKNVPEIGCFLGRVGYLEWPATRILNQGQTAGILNEREREREKRFFAADEQLEILRPTRKPWQQQQDGRKQPRRRPTVRDGERRRRTGTKTMRSAVENSFGESGQTRVLYWATRLAVQWKQTVKDQEKKTDAGAWFGLGGVCALLWQPRGNLRGCSEVLALVGYPDSDRDR